MGLTAYINKSYKKILSKDQIYEQNKVMNLHFNSTNWAMTSSLIDRR